MVSNWALYDLSEILERWIMATFISEGIEIAYETYGPSDSALAPLLLIHGFASNGKVNWVDTGWVDLLVEAGRSVITIDNRGHGQSEKLYDPALYPAAAMARDAANLIDHLNLRDVVAMGFSMGARISAFLAIQNSEKLSAAIIGGMGINLIKGLSTSNVIIEGLTAATRDEVTDRTARQFRIFAEHTKSDLKALAACMGSSRQKISEEDVAGIDLPVLVAVGSEDVTAGPPQALVDLLPRGEVLVIEGRDHMRSTGDPQFKEGVLAFLSRLDG